MPKVKNIEKKIAGIEGFDVKFKHAGQDVRGDKKLQANYSKEKMSKGDYTVSEWRDKCFKKQFPGYEVDVLDVNGDVVTGQTKLCNVRDTYLEDDE